MEHDCAERWRSNDCVSPMSIIAELLLLSEYVFHTHRHTHARMHARLLPDVAQMNCEESVSVSVSVEL